MSNGSTSHRMKPGPADAPRPRRSRAVAVAGLALALAALTAAGPAEAGRGPSPKANVRAAEMPWNRTAYRHDARVAVEWMDQLVAIVRAERLSPPVAARAYGYTGVALYEAVVPAMGDHRSLVGQLNGFDERARPRNRRSYHWPTVANAAVAATVRGLLPAASAASLAAIDALEAGNAAHFASFLPGPVYARSVGHGRRVAASILAWAADDGMSVWNNCPYVPPVGDGLWVPTPPLFAPALQPCWGEVRPFLLAGSGECAPTGPPDFSIDPNSAFFAEGMEVYETTQSLTPEQMAIALFWADNPGQTGTPPGHWVSIAGQIAGARNESLAAAAEAYARVGIAVNDGFISCWETKFVHNLLRPVTYIQQNIDPNWASPLPTPPFPEYTSGHSVQSGAAAEVLTALWGDLAFTDDTHHALGLPARSFSSFREAAAEAAVSRLYGGIHYRSAIEIGIGQGACIGQAIDDRVRFRNR